MKGIVVGVVFALTAQLLAGQTAPRVPLGIVSDWTHHHVLYPDSKDDSVRARIRRDPRWVQNWYLRHREAWWPEHHRRHGDGRDWSVPLEASPVVGFGQIFDFTFNIAPEAGYGSLNTIDLGNDQFLATAGVLTVTSGADVGTYPLYPGGPGVTLSPRERLIMMMFSTLQPTLRLILMRFSLPAPVWRSTSGATVPVIIHFMTLVVVAMERN